METLIVNINKKSIAEEITNILESYGETVKIFHLKSPKKSNNRNNKEFSLFDMTGIWENSDITLEKIREKAWKRS